MNNSGFNLEGNYIIVNKFKVSKKIYFLPPIVCGLLIFTFVTCYGIAVYMQHVEIDFPYISDTGTFLPERCIFGEFLNISAFLLMITLYVRYKLVDKYISQLIFENSRNLKRISGVSYIIGIVGALGLTVVANFQETAIEKVHLTGAMFAFGGGVVYLFLETYVTIRLAPILNLKKLAILRIVVSSISAISFLLTIISSPISAMNFHGKKKTKWFPTDGGWELHVLATAAEWTMAITFCFFILSFVLEFRRIGVTLVHVHLDHAEENIINSANEPSEQNVVVAPVNEYMRF